MRAKKLIPLVLLCLASRALSLTPEIQKAGDELIVTLNEEMRVMKNEDNANEVQALRQYIRQVQNALGQENTRQMDQWLDNFGNYQPSDKATAHLEAIKKAVKDSSERKTRETIAELENLLASAAETLARAEQPEDLDKLLQSLGRNRFNDSDAYDGNNREIRTLISQLSSARQFVTNWQDYLLASNSGDTGKALESLRNLSSQDSTLLPRSQIIARIKHEEADEQDFTTIIEGIRKPEDMREGLRKLNRLLRANRRSGSENTILRDTAQSLGSLEKTYREYLAGLPVSIEVFSQSADSADSVAKSSLIPLRAAILLTVLPRTLDLPAGISPSEGEAVDTFLARAIAETARQGDSAAALRIGTTRRLLTQSSSLGKEELDALRSYSAGQQQLAAGQHVLAVVSLQEALKSGSDLIPAAKVGELLESIRKDHAESYAQGMTEFLTPRPARGFDHSGRFSGPFPPDPAFYGRSDERRGNTTVVIPVPGQEKPARATPAETAPQPPKVPDTAE